VWPLQNSDCRQDLRSASHHPQASRPRESEPLRRFAYPSEQVDKLDSSCLKSSALFTAHFLTNYSIGNELYLYRTIRYAQSCSGRGRVSHPPFHAESTPHAVLFNALLEQSGHVIANLIHGACHEVAVVTARAGRNIAGTNDVYAAPSFIATDMPKQTHSSNGTAL
jgi:hypothetical protein